MHLKSLFSGVISSAYRALFPVIRPNGYFGKLTRAIRERESLEWEGPETVWHRQRDKLNHLLAYATTHVPYYRQLSHEGGLPDRIDQPEDLTAVPILTKAIIREHGDALLADGFPCNLLRHNATGGSTGEPLHFWSDEPTLLLSNAGEAWAGTVAGLSRKSAVAHYWGAGRFDKSVRADFWDAVQHLLANQIFINCFQMDRPRLLQAHTRLTQFEPDGLIGYASALVEYARFLQREGIQPHYPKTAILSAAETLDDASRHVLEETFAVPVFDRYGSREAGLIAMECDRHEGLHIDCENVFVELLEDQDDSAVQRIIVTKLNQLGMPFLRYDIGDLVEGPISWCSCGRGYPVLKKIIGRVTETIRTPQGGCLPGELFPHLFKDCGIRTYRVTQAADYSLDVALVKEPAQTPEQDASLRRIIAEHVGPTVPVSVRYVERIERSATGKLLPVISHAPSVPVRQA